MNVEERPSPGERRRPQVKAATHVRPDPEVRAQVNWDHGKARRFDDVRLT
jgi:hypothetical protein